MPAPNPNAVEFLLNRRSRPQKTLTTPVPDRDALSPILTAALRTPDHGKLEPWRLIVLDGAALKNLAPLARERGAAMSKDQAEIDKGALQFETSELAVVVVESPVASEKVPAIEQTYSAGAVCLAMLNAALASGWGANWLSGFAAHNRPFTQEAFDLADNETVAGIIHIATETNTPPERPRPDMDNITSWLSI